MTKEETDIRKCSVYEDDCEEWEGCPCIYYKALEQQPSDDEITITMKKGTLKYSGHGYVAYNKDWFRKHFATEVKIMTGYDGYIEQPISDDCVSRAELMKLYHESRPTLATNVYEFGEKLQALPPVTPTQSWIPVSERLPEPNRLVMCYITTGTTETYFLALWSDVQKAWEEGISGYRLLERDLGYEVIAWQPLPQPYEEKQGGKVGWSSLENVREKVERGDENG